MRKILVFVLAMLMIVGLVSCGAGSSKIEYTDPSTGEKQEVVIQKTEDEKEVSQSLYAMSMTEKAAKNPTTSSVKATVTSKGEVKDVGSFDVKAEAEASLSYKGETAPKTTFEALDNIDLYLKVSVSGKIPNQDKETVALNDSSIELFLENGVAYAKIALDAKIANLISAGSEQAAGVGETIKMFNDKTLKIDLKTLMSEERLDEEQQAQFELLLNGKEVKIRDLIPEDAQKELKENLDTLVEKLHLTITNVSGTKVTYTADLKAILDEQGKDEGDPAEGAPVEMEDKLSEGTVSVTIDTKDLSIVSLKASAKADDEDVKIDFNADVTCSYTASVGKISDDDKTAAVDLMTMMGNLFGGQGPSYK